MEAGVRQFRTGSKSFAGCGDNQPTSAALNHCLLVIRADAKPTPPTLIISIAVCDIDKYRIMRYNIRGD